MVNSKEKYRFVLNVEVKQKNVHDYREQILKDIPALGKNVYIHLRKRRYRCQCGKRFIEKNTFLAKYQRCTKRLTCCIIDKLREVISYTQVARETNVSVSKVINVFDMVSYSSYRLPEALAIDEFKGNTDGEKYQCILTDPVNRQVVDILPKRFSSYLTEYFHRFPREEREKVKIFVSDMWKTYSDIASVWFKNACQIVDKYHWIRQVIWAFEGVRKDVQKNFSKSHRLYFKHSKRLLIKGFESLSEQQKQQVNIMLYASLTLSQAYFYKEQFLKILHCQDIQTAKNELSEWINQTLDCGILHFQKCAKTLLNWLSGILNSFSTPITNGFTEGCNNKIKVLKRNAYGYRNFKRFRNRILHIFSNQD